LAALPREIAKVYDLVGWTCSQEVLMLSADSAQVNWDTQKKHWSVRVQIGAEVIRRSIPKVPQDAGDEVLRTAAVEAAMDEGYQVDPTKVAISH
jgi:hypothetical protein